MHDRTGQKREQSLTEEKKIVPPPHAKDTYHYSYTKRSMVGYQTLHITLHVEAHTLPVLGDPHDLLGDRY